MLCINLKLSGGGEAEQLTRELFSRNKHIRGRGMGAICVVSSAFIKSAN